MAGIVGTYEMVSSDNYDGFLKAVGVAVIQRTMASKVTPTMTWINEGGKWTQKTKTTLKSFQIVFTEGEEFDEELADGRKCKATITFEGNTLVHKQKMDALTAEVRREFKGDQMVSTFKAGDVVATRVFKKIA
ncbi:unnamed protein product [Orchesella dallaii]|uniref:Cytosolic fatty-acid binding proteins domain-containing protein n=1 Tax=Orchesella dallaii TaxID=48710 RepID=A0ABP1QRW8_9HEXA